MKIEQRDIIRTWTNNGMRQIIESPHLTFNKKTNLIDNSGNLISNTQFATYIRPYSETKCNGSQYKPGELQKQDLKPFKTSVCDYIDKQDKTCDFWITNFYINKLFCTLVINLKTKELKIFNFAKNNKQEILINWLVNYLFKIVE